MERERPGEGIVSWEECDRGSEEGDGEEMGTGGEGIEARSKG